MAEVRVDKAQTAPCVSCRSNVSVPDSYAHGDHIKCGTCGTQHKVNRGEVLRLVLADVGPLRDALTDNRRLIQRIEDELAGARHSFGLGANGIGVGVAYALWEVARQEQPWSTSLALKASGIALASGLALELLNHFFLAKRQEIVRLATELEEARASGRAIEQKIRDATRLR